MQDKYRCYSEIICLEPSHEDLFLRLDQILTAKKLTGFCFMSFVIIKQKHLLLS